MKSIFSVFSLLVLAAGLSAQNSTPAPLFLLFTQDCMDQLEYRYTYSGNGVQAYTVRPNSNEEFLLKAGSEGITSPTLPKGAVTCRGFTMNAAFVDAINQSKRQVYVVHQTPSGYLQMPIIEAGQVTRNGTFYLFKAANYAFALDSTKMVGAVNLATANSGSYVYLTGVAARVCRREYSFRREPAQAGMERTDFDYIPGIGITMMRSGMSAAEAEGNTRRLVKVNGVLLDDYLTAACKNQNVPQASTVPQYAPEFGYGSTKPPGTGIAEPGKEDYPGMANPNGGAPVGPPPAMIACPERPGYGYHIVQPKETLRAIARTYNVDIKKIQQWNDIKNANHIEICQKVWVTKPPSNATAVAKGAAPAVAKPKPEEPRVFDQSIYWGNQQQQNAPAAATYSYAQPGATTTGNPYYFSQIQPPPAATRPLTHTIKRGEYLYAISKTYNCPEECIRRANNMPMQGDVPLQVGQQITIPDCSNCQAVNPNYNGGQPQKQVAQPVPGSTGYYPPTPLSASPVEFSAPSYSNLLNDPQSGAPAPRPLNPSARYNAPAAAQYYTPSNPQPQYLTPNNDLYANPTEQFLQTQVAGSTNPQQVAKSPNQPQQVQAAYFQEYVVKQGENLAAIAMRFQVSAAEISQVNSLEPNETLMPGKRLLIPRQ